MVYKCGQYVYLRCLRYMFLGYVEKKQAMLADKYGNRYICFLSEIGVTNQYSYLK